MNAKNVCVCVRECVCVCSHVHALTHEHTHTHGHQCSPHVLLEHVLGAAALAAVLAHEHAVLLAVMRAELTHIPAIILQFNKKVFKKVILILPLLRIY